MALAQLIEREVFSRLAAKALPGEADAGLRKKWDLSARGDASAHLVDRRQDARDILRPREPVGQCEGLPRPHIRILGALQDPHRAVDIDGACSTRSEEGRGQDEGGRTRLHVRTPPPNQRAKSRRRCDRNGSEPPAQDDHFAATNSGAR